MAKYKTTEDLLNKINSQGYVKEAIPALKVMSKGNRKVLHEILGEYIEMRYKSTPEMSKEAAEKILKKM